MTGDDLQVETNPTKKGRKAVSVPIQNVPSQVMDNGNQEFFVPANPPVITADPPVPLAVPPVMPAVDDDAKSQKSQKSTTSSARLRQLKADREASKRLHEIDKELLEKEREAILRDMKFRKAIAKEVEVLEEVNVIDAPVNPTIVPPAKRNEMIQTWIQNAPLNKAEHPYAIPAELTAMNRNMEQLLARQTVPKDLPNFSGDPADWFGFIYHFEHTTQICGFN